MPISATAHWEVPAKPDQISALRGWAADFAAGAGIDDQQLDDVRTAVSEAATNVVLHAYDRSARRHCDMRMDLELVGSQLVVRVRDHGVGVAHHLADTGKGIGMRVMATLADSFEMRHCHDGGTEVQMGFELGADRSAHRPGAVRHN